MSGARSCGSVAPTASRNPIVLPSLSLSYCGSDPRLSTRWCRPSGRVFFGMEPGVMLRDVAVGRHWAVGILRIGDHREIHGRFGFGPGFQIRRGSRVEPELHNLLLARRLGHGAGSAV